ncbi:MAG: hypothetical protein R3343_02130 [Nitriliruptorales bacterium]|nr:hypothetical protein [Nitriliruptorales bacterium]
MTVTTDDDERHTEPDARTESHAGDSAEAPRQPPSRFWLVAPWVLAVLGLAAAAFSTWQWLDLKSAEDTRAEVQAAATDFVLTLTNWDATDGLDDTVDELRAAGSEQFLEEIDQLFGGDLRQQLEQSRAVSTGEIQDVFVQSIDEREAVVFAVVIQRLELGLRDESSSMVRSARISLKPSGDGWLVSRVELVNDSGVGPDGGDTEEGS